MNEYNSLNNFSCKYFLFMARYNPLTTSSAERQAYRKKRACSAFDCPVDPSAIFNDTESAAFFYLRCKNKNFVLWEILCELINPIS